MPMPKNSHMPGSLREMQHLPINAVHERSNNSRIHKPTQVRKIADAIRTFGFIVPLLIDENGFLLAGHGRLAAARLLGMQSVPTLSVSGLSEAQQRAFVIADNKLTDLSSFDPLKLADEFRFLIDADPTFELESTAFDIVEIDRLLNFDDVGLGEDEVALPPADMVPISRPGDLWQVGAHRILCGDALDRLAHERLFGSDRAALIFTDPPYNVPIAGHVSGLGAKVHREFAMASGEMSRPEYTYQFLRPAFTLVRDFSLPGALAFVCIDWRHLLDIQNAVEGLFYEHKNTICWVKSNAGMGSFYRSQRELIAAYKVSKGPHRNNFGLGGKGRHRSNVWQYPGVNTFRAGRKDDLEAHPTVKPLAMVRDAILDCSAPNDIVFDAFLGSGTTALAAAAADRRCYGIEIDPIFVDVIVNRLTSGTKLTARLDSDETFAEVAHARGLVMGEERP